MRTALRPMIALLYVLCCARGAAVLAGDGLTITLNNDSSDNILITAYDQSSSPPRKILASTAVYGSASITVAILANSHGRGHLSWTAVSADPDMRMCGHGDNAHLNDGDTVAVHADSDCHN
jgi:hypothetical protein